MIVLGVPTGPARRTSLKGHTDTVRSLTFTPDGRLLVSAGDDKTIRLWDPATGQEVRALSGHEKGVSRVVCSPDGRRLISLGRDGSIKLWDPANGQMVLELRGKTPVFSPGLAISPDGLSIAAGNGTNVQVWLSGK